MEDGRAGLPERARLPKDPAGKDHEQTLTKSRMRQIYDAWVDEYVASLIQRKLVRLVRGWRRSVSAYSRGFRVIASLIRYGHSRTRT